jgi:RND family efflux transporter MFP subunit
MKHISKIITIFLLTGILVASCSNPKTNGKRNFGKQTKEEAILVMVQEMQPRDLDKYIKITGKLEGITDVNFLSETSGKVVEIYKKLGDWVNKGEAIGRVDNIDAENQLKQAEAALMAGEAALESANINFRVSQNLYNKEMISESDYLLAKSNQKNAQASHNGLQASLEIARKKFENSTFNAPVSGYLAEMNLEIGEMVSAGSLIAAIVNSKKLLIKTGVSESDIPYVKKGDRVIITHMGKEYEAKVTGVGIRPKTGSNNYSVEIEMANPKGVLYPGMVIDGRIFSRTFKNVLYTSIENLREKYDQEFVYVVKSDNRVEMRIVELGEKVTNNIIVKSGLEVGDQLVIDGIDSVSNGSLVEVKSGFGN